MKIIILRIVIIKMVNSHYKFKNYNIIIKIIIMKYIEISDQEILKLIQRNKFLFNDKYIKKRINKIVIKN